MKLSDVMGAAGLSIYAELGLILFLGAFLAVVYRVIFPGKDDQYELDGQIPLSDEPVLLRHGACGGHQEEDSK